MLEAYLKHVTPTLTLLGDWYVHWNKMTMAFVAAGLDLLTVFPVVGQAAVFAGVILFFRNTLRLDEKAIHLLLSYPLTEVARLPAPHIDINLPTMLGSKILTDEWMH